MNFLTKSLEFSKPEHDRNAFDFFKLPATLSVTLSFALAGCGAQSPYAAGIHSNATHSDSLAENAKSVTAETGAVSRAIESFEDCVALDLATVAVKYIGGEWKIVDGPGGNHWAFSFGSLKDEAYQALKVIKAYKFANSCFVSRPAPKMVYQLTAAGNAAAATSDLIPNEDCIAFDNASVEAKWFPAPANTWKIVQGNMWMLDFGLDQAGVYKALRVIKLKKFNQQCFVGRPDPSFSYWKIK